MIYNNFYYGIGRSKYDQSSFDNMVNVDVHSVPGEARCQLALITESTTPNEACVLASVPTGDVYFFSKSSGKIWKRASGTGVYSLVRTSVNASHYGAKYFNGYIYFATATTLGRFDLSATWTDTWKTFSEITGNRPMEERNASLFIGNGRYVSAVDSAGTFADNSLDLPSNYSVTALAGVGTDLLVAAQFGNNMTFSKVFLWDTYSSSWTIEDTVQEPTINVFIIGDNIVFAQAGEAGNIYYWTGAQMVRFGKVRGIISSLNTYNTTNYKGRALYADGTKIFSIHRESPDLPWAIVQEYTAAGEVESMESAGQQLYISIGTGIQKIDTNYAIATIDTPESYSDKQGVIVKYDPIYGGGGIDISTSVNGGAFTAQTTIWDSVKNIFYFDGGLGRTNFKQARITMTPLNDYNIGIKSIEL